MEFLSNDEFKFAKSLIYGASWPKCMDYVDLFKIFDLEG
jgi:hypothetical protein